MSDGRYERLRAAVVTVVDAEFGDDVPAIRQVLLDALNEPGEPLEIADLMTGNSDGPTRKGGRVPGSLSARPLGEGARRAITEHGEALERLADEDERQTNSAPGSVSVTFPSLDDECEVEFIEAMDALTALRGCVEALESVAPMTPHVRGCDAPDDPCCVRCVIDSEIARGREEIGSPGGGTDG